MYIPVTDWKYFLRYVNTFRSGDRLPVHRYSKNLGGVVQEGTHLIRNTIADELANGDYAPYQSQKAADSYNDGVVVWLNTNKF
jgi:hypothetical protein